MSSVISLKIHIIVQIDAESTQPAIAPLGMSPVQLRGKRGGVITNQNHVIASVAWQSPQVSVDENSHEIASSFLLAMTYEKKRGRPAERRWVESLATCNYITQAYLRKWPIN